MSILRRLVLIVALVLIGWAMVVVWFTRTGIDGVVLQAWRPVQAFTVAWRGNGLLGASGQVALLAAVALAVAATGLVVSDEPPPWMRVVAIVAASTMVVAGVGVVLGGRGDAVLAATVPPVLFQLASIAALVVAVPRVR